MKLSSYNQFLLKNESIMSDEMEVLTSEVKGSSKWKELDLSKESIVALRAWRHPLSKKGFNCLIRIIEVGKLISAIFYIEDIENEQIHFMDYMVSPIIPYYKRFFNSGYNKYTNFALDSCEYQLDYFNNLEKFPNSEDVKKCLFDFFDEGFDLLSDISYGYKNNISDTANNHSLTLFSKYYHSNSDFICSFILKNLYNVADSIIDDLVNGFEFHLQENHGDFTVEYFNDERGLVIYFGLT